MRSTTVILALVAVGCNGDKWEPHGPVADGIFAPMGEPLPSASEEQLAAFERGKAVVEHRFTREEGLGPAFNVTFCGSCHERPTFGGAAGLYRNFFIGGRRTEDGAFFFAESAGNDSGVIRMYNYGPDYDARPEVPASTTVITQRNPIPFFGVGLLAELTNDELLKRVDENDEDEDGISGRANFDRGFVGRFGAKSQTVSIEGFIRGPLMNHLGITTDPLTEEQRAQLPVDSSSTQTGRLVIPGLESLQAILQAAAPDGPLTDDDPVADPEMSGQDLFDLVTFSMLLAAPQPEALDEERLAGMQAFDEVGCASCHTPRLQGPRGALPVYSDLLVHDMGPELDDGLVMKDAGTSEFRTQPLWGLSAVGPYLHDGRAETVEEAIEWHGGEAEAARDAYLALSQADQDAVVEFLLSLGGRSQYSVGLIPPDTPIDEVGEWGGPFRNLSRHETAQFLSGRTEFDREYGFESGAGAPRFNGDSCRACHFEPVVGGAGPAGVNVMRHGWLATDGTFVPPDVGTILHKQTSLFEDANVPQDGVHIFEHRQTPHTLGLGLIERIDEGAILANADPDDADKDGISGRPNRVSGDRLGRFGWKAQVPSVDEFVRDAMLAEIGLTMEAQPGLTFGATEDDDGVPDPEFPLDKAADLAFYLKTLAGPPRTPADDVAQAEQGEALFATVGCAACHVPELDDVPLYSDLLLHDILPEDMPGIADTQATMREFRTAPLWGLAHTAPYTHTGEADTIAQAIELHDGEAQASRSAYRALTPTEQDALLAFLNTL
ncbi:MAG: c-type cytochrome [Myxococcales bacterium]|nr:c-type cytochrome [Myxococcales bacterium]